MANAFLGAIVSLYNTGQALGTFITGYSADKFSRRWTICAAGIICMSTIDLLFHKQVLTTHSNCWCILAIWSHKCWDDDRRQIRCWSWLWDDPDCRSCIHRWSVATQTARHDCWTSGDDDLHRLFHGKLYVQFPSFIVTIWQYIVGIGYGGDFATGNAQWRIPLAMQIPGAVALSIGCIFIPYSPRWCTYRANSTACVSG